jgi:hypothetical protein
VLRPTATALFERVQTSTRRPAPVLIGPASSITVPAPFERVQFSPPSSSSSPPRRPTRFECSTHFEPVQMSPRRRALQAPARGLRELGGMASFERVQTDANPSAPPQNRTPFKSALTGSFERVQSGRPRPPAPTHHPGGTPMQRHK